MFFVPFQTASSAPHKDPGQVLTDTWHAYRASAYS